MYNQPTNGQAPARKAWGNGPQLTLIGQNTVAGGGGHTSVWERTGHRINESTGSGRQTLFATPVLYNNATVHS